MAHRRELGQRCMRAPYGWAPRASRRPGRQRLNGRQSPGPTRTVRCRNRVLVPCRCCIPCTLILLDDTGERTIIAVDSGAGPSSFLPVRAPDLRSVDCVYVEGYTRYPTSTAAAAESALLVTSPPVPGATTWPATVVVGSETQYLDVTPAAMFEAVRSVSGERLKWVVVTRGREGADAYAASSEVHVDAVAADQIDATGAGDAFTVGLLNGLLQGEDMVTALQAGAAWGAATVAQLGSIPVPWEELAGPFHQPGDIRPLAADAIELSAPTVSRSSGYGLAL